jgi:hypothetical protein
MSEERAMPTHPLLKSVFLLISTLIMVIMNHSLAANEMQEIGDLPNQDTILSTEDLMPAGAIKKRRDHANASDITKDSRADGYNDFLRLVWVPPGTAVTSITLGKRAFFTAATFFKPPATVDGFLDFIGNFYRDGQDLVIMRCRPTPEQRQVVNPLLATWPNVLPAIADDLGGPAGNCTSPNLSPGEQQICNVARQYEDVPQDVYIDGVREMAELASHLYDTPESADSLRTDYGIFPAFTGLGFAVRGSSANGVTPPMTTGSILANSVVPEYLLINARLKDATCRCVQVPDYEQRHTAQVDSDFIWKRGKLDNGACRRIDRLPASAQAF